MKNKENNRKIVRWLVVISMVVFLLGAITPILSIAGDSEKNSALGNVSLI